MDVNENMKQPAPPRFDALQSLPQLLKLQYVQLPFNFFVPLSGNVYLNDLTTYNQLETNQRENPNEIFSFVIGSEVL